MHRGWGGGGAIGPLLSRGSFSLHCYAPRLVGSPKTPPPPLSADRGGVRPTACGCQWGGGGGQRPYPDAARPCPHLLAPPPIGPWAYAHAPNQWPSEELCRWVPCGGRKPIKTGSGGRGGGGGGMEPPSTAGVRTGSSMAWGNKVGTAKSDARKLWGVIHVQKKTGSKTNDDVSARPCPSNSTNTRGQLSEDLTSCDAQQVLLREHRRKVSAPGFLGQKCPQPTLY